MRESHYIHSSSGNKLHLLEFIPKSSFSKPILFIHGAIENGTIFYSKGSKGLAPYLQECGFHCFVLDLRGRGNSTPALSRSSSFGQEEIIREDFPRIIDYIRGMKKNLPLNFITHSWGGVLVNAFLLEFPTYKEYVGKMVHFAAKRHVAVMNPHRLFYIDFAWLILGSIIVKLWGYLPKNFFGPDGESAGTLKDSQKWIYSKEWTDSKAGICYSSLAKESPLPQTLYLAGTKDFCLGHPSDVLRFALESGHSQQDVVVLGLSQGQIRDYDHISLLTAKEAPKEHFQKVIAFFNL